MNSASIAWPSITDSINRLISTATIAIARSSFFAQDSIRSDRTILHQFRRPLRQLRRPHQRRADQRQPCSTGRRAPTWRPGSHSPCFCPAQGQEKLFAADNNDWAGRLGFSYALSPSGDTVVRGGYGIFYDRSFDNLWENLALNNVLLELGIPHTADRSATPAADSIAGPGDARRLELRPAGDVSAGPADSLRAQRSSSVSSGRSHAGWSWKPTTRDRLATS